MLDFFHAKNKLSIKSSYYENRDATKMLRINMWVSIFRDFRDTYGINRNCFMRGENILANILSKIKLY